MKKLENILLATGALIMALTTGFAQNPQWKPQADEVYLQELGEKVITEKPVSSIALQKGSCYLVIDKMMYSLNQGVISLLAGAPKNVNRLKVISGEIWALTASGLYRLNENIWQQMDNRNFTDLCFHNGKVLAATVDEIFMLNNGKFETIKPKGGYYSSDITMIMEDGSQVHADPVQLGPIKRIESYSGTLYVLRPDKLIQFDGKVVNEDFIDWGRLPSNDTREMLGYGNRLLISTSKGLGVLRGASLSIIKGSDGLPVENTGALEKGMDGDIWIGTPRGAIRMMQNEWQYFGAENWLPDEKVNAIAAADNIVYIATDKGLGIIRYVPYTLQKKAAYYEQWLNDWGQKRLGFIHTLSLKNGEWIREISDNDGGHTATYLAAMSYKYAATGNEGAKNEAIEAFKAMQWLERITPIDGLIARSIWSTTADKDERSKEGSGGLPARWNPTKDGKWYWKGDVSSDEVTAHFYAVSLFYDLVAEGKDKEMAREHLKRMASYILKCGYTMHDLDGKPTRWARWNPEYLLRPYGYNDRGLNALEILSYMQSTWAITGDKKFEKALQQLASWGYPELTIRQKNTFPPATLAPWDNNLAFESYNTLLRYTKDPVLRSVYLRSLDRTWEIKRMEHLPWYNFSYGALTGNDCEADKAVKHLRDWAMNCAANNYRNSHRDDLHTEPGYNSYEGVPKSLSPRETIVYRGAGNGTVMDGGANSNVIMEPASFLRDYWMGRYHGIILAPTTQDPELNSLKQSGGEKKGAAAFNGPARPILY